MTGPYPPGRERRRHPRFYVTEFLSVRLAGEVLPIVEVSARHVRLAHHEAWDVRYTLQPLEFISQLTDDICSHRALASLFRFDDLVFVLHYVPLTLQGAAWERWLETHDTFYRSQARLMII